MAAGSCPPPTGGFGSSGFGGLASSSVAASIRVLNGAAAGREVSLTKVVTTVGKPGVQVASVTKRPGGYVLSHVEGARRPSVNGQLVGEDSVALKHGDGEPAVAMDAHVRLAHPEFNNGARLLRRGYNFVDGSDGLGRLDAGLFFIAYQRDPRRQFVPIQHRLAAHDRLNEYIVHTGSAVFAVPPGVLRGGYVGETLLASRAD